MTQGDLHVQAAVPVMEIRQFHMKVQANAHPAFYLEGMLSEEAGEEGIRIPLSGTTVRIGAGDRLLFTGILEEAEVVQEGRGYEIIMRGAAATRLLDCRKKARSFQDVSMTYRQVMEQVLADTPGAGLDLHVEDRVIGRPLYQLEETDWGFLKRLAGHLGTAIMPRYILWRHRSMWDNPRGAASPLVQGPRRNGAGMTGMPVGCASA